ncbi:MAG TPA: DNA polymerase/3'-5' exonuclease PolX [Actinomycetota bacterium]
MPRANEELEELLSEWAELLAVSGADAFRVRAYEKAARAIGGEAEDVRAFDDRAILAIPSVGKSMLARVREYLDTGTVQELEDLREAIPGGMRELLRIPGLGPKKAMLVHRELGVASIADLQTAIAGQKLRGVKGLGAKTEENLARNVANLRATGDRILLDAAMTTAEAVIASITEAVDVEAISFAGSLRRMRETIGDLDVLVASEDAGPVMEAFCAMPRVAEVIAHGTTKSSIRTRKGFQVDLRVVPADSWGAALIYFTGSKEHNIALRHRAIERGLKLSEWGLFEAESGSSIAARTEEEVYAALDLPWFPPTMRENTGEIEAAGAGTLPEPVTVEDLRGDLHSHTDMTDGVAPLERMVEAAAARGYEYYVITDHAEDLAMTGASREQMLDQRKKIARLQKKYPAMRLLHGSELNIGKDGGVDYDPEFLAGYDLLVASVHSLFRLSREETTARLIAAMENPNVHVVGHPMARLIGRREPIDCDFDAVCGAAVRTGTALEVNCFPDRLDLRDDLVRRAVERGVTLAIDTDSHAPRDLENVRYGVATAQRGWARAADVLNARPVEDVLAHVAAKRARA